MADLEASSGAERWVSSCLFFSLRQAQGARLKEICGKYPPPSPNSLLIHYKQTKDTHAGHGLFNQAPSYEIFLVLEILLVLIFWSVRVSSVYTKINLHCSVRVWEPTYGRSIDMTSRRGRSPRPTFHFLKKAESQCRRLIPLGG